MKRMNHKNWVWGLVTLMLLIGFQANAQRGRGYGAGRGNDGGYGRGYGNGPGPFNRMEEVLDLSEEQKEQIEKLHLDFQKQSLANRNQIREKSAELTTLITEEAGEVKINELLEEIGDLQTENRKQRISTHMKVRDVLTDEQKVRFDTRFANRFGLFGRHFGPRGRYGSGWK